jgi:ligand-binding sensor domain-containing protein
MSRPYSRTLLVCTSLTLFSILTFALDPSLQISQYAHKAWRFEDEGFIGAPSAFAQTKDGYLWIGTQSGLLRFDGVRFVPWPETGGPELPSDFISTLLGASDGSLWIGTGRGLVRWKDGTLTNYSSVPALIGTILEDNHGEIWLARAKIRDGKGPLCQVMGSELRCHGKDNGIALRYGKELQRDSQGNFWISGPNQITRWRADSAQTYSSDALDRLQGVLAIDALALDPDDRLWVGMRRTGKGLGLQQLLNGSWKDYVVPGFDGARTAVNALFVDRDRSLWIGTPNQGIYRLHNGQVDHFSSTDGLSSDAVEYFYQDREGDLWVATSKGIDRFHDAPVTTYSTREDLPHIPIRF